jgi:peptidase M28-like protein
MTAQTSEATPPSPQAATVPSSLSEASPPPICTPCVRAHMEFLASDALQGRGSGTRDELLAATYIASELRAYGIAPAGDNGAYMERVTIVRQTLSAPPILKFMLPVEGSMPKAVTWKHGKEILALYLSQPGFSGPLQKTNLDQGEPQIKPGAVVWIIGKNYSKVRRMAFSAMSRGAVAVLLAPSAGDLEQWEELGKHPPELLLQLESSAENAQANRLNLLAVNAQAQDILRHVPDGTMIRLQGTAGPEQKSNTWNVIGILHGQERAAAKNIIVLSAHLDHLGIGAPVNGDRIYHGADDDASGVSAVLEFARILSAGPRPRRTVIFALFGSEEVGELGSTYFSEHPPVALQEIAANLEFEMIGRRDPDVPGDTLWLTGWERSDLGPELAAHGAKLVADPHTEEDFFRRSDNYALARDGVVAQTISSFGLHEDYHQPTDDLEHINWEHLDTAIGSMIRPLEWLVHSNFRPVWKAGEKP